MITCFLLKDDRQVDGVLKDNLKDIFMSHIMYRRFFGFIFGALLGILYTGFSQTINHFVMPGIPLYQPPFGISGNILVGTLVGLLLGGVIAWSETTARGVLYSSLLGALLVAAVTLLTGKTGPGSWGPKITATLLIFFPIAAGLALPMFTLRWVFNREEHAFQDNGFLNLSRPIPQVILPLTLLLLAAGMGTFSLTGELGRSALPRMNKLLEQGQQSQNTAGLPAPLQAPGVNRFLDFGLGSYTLEWDKDDTNRFVIPRPNIPFSEQSIVIAHFNNNYLLVCMFPGATGQLACRDFVQGQPTD